VKNSKFRRGNGTYLEQVSPIFPIVKGQVTRKTLAGANGNDSPTGKPGKTVAASPGIPCIIRQIG
jgi:hypothetical protein